jgi:hypothetical protein
MHLKRKIKNALKKGKSRERQNKFLIKSIHSPPTPPLHVSAFPFPSACIRQRISQRDRASHLTSLAPQSTASAGLCRRSRGAPPHLILSQLSRDSCICEERGRFGVVLGSIRLLGGVAEIGVAFRLGSSDAMFVPMDRVRCARDRSDLL